MHLRIKRRQQGPEVDATRQEESRVLSCRVVAAAEQREARGTELRNHGGRQRTHALEGYCLRVRDDECDDIIGEVQTDYHAALFEIDCQMSNTGHSLPAAGSRIPNPSMNHPYTTSFIPANKSTPARLSGLMR